MKPETNQDTLYQVTQYDGEKITSAKMTRQQLKAIEPQSVNHYLSFAFGQWGYRNLDGQWIANDLDCCGLGNTGLAILMATQNSPGEYLTPRDVWIQTDVYSLLTPNNLSARWMSLRRLHGETFSKPNFFFSRRTGGMAVAWNRKCTWMRVERLSHSTGN